MNAQLIFEKHLGTEKSPKKCIFRLSVMLENSEPWRSTNSRGGSPSQCDCRRASEGMLTFEEVTEQEDEGQTGSTNQINITQNPIQVRKNPEKMSRFV